MPRGMGRVRVREGDRSEGRGHASKMITDDDRIAQMERDGLLVPPLEPMRLDLLRSPPLPADCSAIDALIEERD